MPRWARRAAVGLAVAVGLAGVGLVYLISRDTTTPVDVDEAVGRYREDQSGKTTTTSPADRARPDPGVYVYATEGTEHIDLLGGATHDYPAQTTLTVATTDCGVRLRWEPIRERWDEEVLCERAGGLERQTLHTHHEFFAFSDDQDFTCEPGYVVVPADPELAQTWSTACDGAGIRIVGTGEVLGFETRMVDGRAVETVHVRVSETTSGSSNGDSRDDYWFRRTDGLLIERASSVRSDSDTPIGAATYEERFTLRLTSLTPRT